MRMIGTPSCVRTGLVEPATPEAFRWAQLFFVLPSELQPWMSQHSRACTWITVSETGDVDEYIKSFEEALSLVRK